MFVQSEGDESHAVGCSRGAISSLIAEPEEKEGPKSLEVSPLAFQVFEQKGILQLDGTLSLINFDKRAALDIGVQS